MWLTSQTEKMLLPVELMMDSVHLSK